MIDSEQYQLLLSLKDTKSRYRNTFDRLRDLQAALDRTQQGVTDATRELVTAFEHWFTTHGGGTGGNTAGMEVRI